MATKRRKSLAMMAKMKSLQRKRKSKQTLSMDPCEEEQLDDDHEEVVTFIEKSQKETENEFEGGMIATTSNATSTIDRVQFYLEDGRLNVPEVFDHLNASELQYEIKPGIWRNLKSLKSGKSTNKFKHTQEIYFRRTGLRDWWPWKSRGSIPWVDEWLVEGDTRKTYCGRVSRLCFDNEKGVVGTAVRFENPYGLVLTAHHCCTYKDPHSGLTLARENLFAFNTQVDIVHLSDNYDLAFLLLKSGPYVGGFRLATRDEEKRGRVVRMISFPWHVDNAYGFDHANVVPTEVHGHIANLGPEEQKLPLFVDALATYMGGFAASPGGAVTLNSKVLVGIHVRAIWHQKGEKILPFKGKNKNSNQEEDDERHAHLSVKRSNSYSKLQRKKQGETSSQGDTSTRKKRKMSTQHNNEKEMNTCYPGFNTDFEVQDDHRQVNLVNSRREQKNTNRDNNVKCSMYHGYLSTYLSSRRIKQEYDEFIDLWSKERFPKNIIKKEFDNSDEQAYPSKKRRRKRN